jgi:uncharacterized protein YtpQ (UPF0354 family)
MGSSVPTLATLSRSLVAMFALAACVVARAQDVPTDQAAFTDYVADKMRQEAVGTLVTVKSPLTLSIGSLQANLDRIHAYCKSNSQGCAAEIDRYVKGASQVVKERNAPLDKTSVRLVVRSSEYIKRAQASLGPDGPILQAKPLVEGLVVVAVLDTPRAIRPLDNRDLASLKLSQDELLELGRKNLEANLKPLSEVAKAVASGQIGTISGSTFDTSRVLLRDQWASLSDAQGGVILVSLPTTDTLLYISEATPTAIGALRTLSRDVMSKAPNSLSTAILKWSSNSWELVP